MTKLSKLDSFKSIALETSQCITSQVKGLHCSLPALTLTVLKV